MSISYSKVFKRAYQAILFLVTFTHVVHGYTVSQSQVTHHAREAAKRHLTDQGFNHYDLPTKLQPEFDQNIDIAAQNVLSVMRQERRNTADSYEIEKEIRFTLKGLVQNLRTIILSRNLEYEVADRMRKIAQDNNVSIDNLSSSLKNEYYQKKESIISKMRNVMTQDGRNYVRINEIEKEIKSSMKDFFQRAQASSSAANSSDSWWDSFFESSNNNNTSNSSYNNSSSNYSSSSSSTNNRVNRAQLDKKVLDIAHQTLRNKGINPSEIPARAVSDFSDKIRAITQRMQNHMNYTYQDYVIVQDIEQAADAELQSVVDKIFLRGEMCAICQDDYKSGEKVGILTCGHLFHKDCIYEWLNHQKTCPLCRQTNVIVTKQERVP